MGYTLANMRNQSQISTINWVSLDAPATPAWLSVIAVAGAATLAAWVKIPLPFTPVPLSLQTFVVLLAPFAVGRGRATAGMMLYLGLGALGAPIFTTPFGPTAGYLLGFIAAPWVISRFRSPAYGIVAATLAIYTFGALWLSIWLQISPMTAVLLGVAPYVPGDILKAAAAYGLINYVRPPTDALD